MPMASVTLKPGVNTQQTFALNEAGVSQSQLIRYKDSLIQSYGGWQGYNGIVAPSTVRDMHAWQGASNDKYLAFGATQSLTVYKSATGTVDTITPEGRATNVTLDLSISSGSDAVTIVDPNSAVTVFDTVYIITPMSIGNMFLNGPYRISAVLSTGSYVINSGTAASTTIVSSGRLLVFSTVANSATVTGEISNNDYQSIPGLFEQFLAATSVGGQTIQGRYLISSIIDSTAFTITLAQQSSATATSTINGGLAQYGYFITEGPQASGSGFGAGGFGLGGFGTGVAISGEPGTPVPADDWTLDNWGEILLACPKDGAIYSWSANSGFFNSQVVYQAPFFNGGIFVSMPQQILVAWKSCQSTGVQNNLVVRWSDSEDFTNWEVNNQTEAGSFTIPTGSYIVGGMQCPNYGLISTDIDVWTMNYIGGDLIFNFTRVGSGCGWAGPHAAGTLGGINYWCGGTASRNFFMLAGSGGVRTMPCPVWDAIFQNLSAANAHKICCAVNTSFNEITWFYPSSASAGENDSYVKVHIEGQEYEWDYGLLPRTAWVDTSVLGPPIAADPSGFAYQHETGDVISGVGLPSFRSGWWAVSDGNELSFIDFVMPDFQWAQRDQASEAQIALTFYSVDYPGDIPKTHGPYIVTQATEFLNVRIRARLVSVLVQLQNSEFFRLGRIRYRWAPAGRR